PTSIYTLSLHDALPISLAFEGKWLGHNCDCERTHFAGQRGDDRGRTGAGSATQPGGDKDHVGAFERLDNFVRILKGSFTAKIRIGARAQTIGELDAQLNFGGGP